MLKYDIVEGSLVTNIHQSSHIRNTHSQFSNNVFSVACSWNRNAWSAYNREIPIHHSKLSFGPKTLSTSACTPIHSKHAQQTATLVDWKTLTSCASPFFILFLTQVEILRCVCDCESHMPEGKLLPRLAPSVQK